jgi:arylformamidase
MSRIIDISPRIDTGLAVWPGDTEFRVHWVSRMEQGASCNVSALTTTPHLGAHADGPLHFDPGGASIGDLELSPYLGPCRVVDVTGVRVVDEDALFGVELYGVERVLFRTGTFPDPRQWNEDFAWIDSRLARRLARLGVKLVGIDTPSVDAFDSRELPTHHVLLETGVRNLEGLDLSEVEAGAYELIALPLRLGGVDSSPVRAVLRTLSSGGN